MPLGIAHDKMAVFSWESTGVEKVKGRTTRCPCSLPTVGLCAEALRLSGPRGAVLCGFWVPLSEEEKEGPQMGGPNGGTSGFCGPCEFRAG